jgi:hypothetical protein
VYGDGRTYVERSTERFDVVELTLVDTFAAISSGALALAEDFLYTTEAFEAYVEHLAPDGILMLGRTRLESQSLLALLDPAARRLGLPLASHVFIARGRAVHGLVLLFKRSPFTADELDRALAFAGRSGMEIVYAPGRLDSALPEVRTFLTRSAAADTGALAAAVAPEHDDAPFYFRQSKWSQLLGTYTGGLGNLLIILSVAIVFGIAFILVPLLRIAPRAASRSGWTLAYFAFIGLAYIVVEMVLLVRFTLLLGHPTRSLTVTLFALLVSSGLGALGSGQLRVDARRRVALLPALTVAVLAAAYSLWLPSLVSAAMPLPLPARVILTDAAIAPLGILMGMPLATGIALLRRDDPQLVIWAWGINGFCSVLGSVLAIIGAQQIGYRATMVAAAGLYLAAGLAIAPAALRPPRALSSQRW